MKPPVRRPTELLAERASRIELLAAMLRSQGLSAGRAAAVLRAELVDLAEGAEASRLESLGALARAMRMIVEDLGGLTLAEERGGRDVLVLDDNEVTRDLITLALEAEGHRVRVSADLDEFVARFEERRPDVILAEVRIPRAPVRQFCIFLRQIIKAENVPIVIFSSASGPELEALAHEAGADRWLSKDQGLNGLIQELEGLFEEILW